MQVNVLVFEKENMEDIPTYDQIYASDVVRVYLCVHLCVSICISADECGCMCYVRIYTCACGCVCNAPCSWSIRKIQTQRTLTIRAMQKIPHCPVEKGAGKEQR